MIPYVARRLSTSDRSTHHASLQSSPGYTIEEAAAALDRPAAWVVARIEDGTVRPLRRTWDPDRLYLSEPMLGRLREAMTTSQPDPINPAEWIRVGEAALEAGSAASIGGRGREPRCGDIRQPLSVCVRSTS